MTKYFKIIFVFSFLFPCFFSYSQTALEKGWQHFAHNEFDEARTAFVKALDGTNVADAHLALSFLAAAQEAPDNKERVQHYLDFYKTSSNPKPYLKALWNLDYAKQTEQEVELIETLYEKETGTLKALATQALGNHNFYSAEFRNASAYYEEVGAIPNWSILGEFENISESGFDKDFGALTHPEQNHTFINKLGVAVQWFDIKAPRFDNWVDLEYFFPAQDAIIYAQNFCYSPKEQEVQFRIGVSGSVKTWLNDQLLFSEAQERNNDIDAYIFTAKLEKGYNRILIQIGESEAGYCNFLLRITDDQGQNIEDLSFTTARKPYNSNYQYDSQLLTDEAEAFFNQKIQDNPEQLENYLILGQYYVYTDNLFKAKQVLQKARERFPECAYLIFQQISLYAKDGNRTQVVTLQEELKTKAPNSSYVLSMKLAEANDRDDLEEQEKLINQLSILEGKTASFYHRNIQLASEKGQREFKFRLIEQAYEAYPDNYSFVNLKYYFEKDVKKSKKKAIKVLCKYLKDNYSEQAVQDLAYAYFDNEEYDEGIETYSQLVEHNPIAIGYYSTLASFYFGYGKYKKAKAVTQECLRIAPYGAFFHETLGNTYMELGMKAEAIDAFKKAILYNPYNYDARRQLRNLRNEGDVFSKFPEQDVYALYENAPDAAEYPDVHSIILADDAFHVVYPGGGVEEKHSLLVKVFNTDGVDYWKEYQVSGQVEKAEVLKKNGSRIAAQTMGGHVVFSNLEEGDAIHLTYRLQNHYFGKLAKHFWGAHYFESFLPIQQSRFSLMVPKGTDFQYKVENGVLNPEIVDQGQFERYTWQVADVPAMQIEPYMSNLVDVGQVLHYSSFPDWNYIAEWYADLAKAKAKVNFEVEQTAKELFAGRENLPKQEKAKIIYDYVVDNIRYRYVSFLQSGWIPQKASTTISAKQGDCKDVSTLFVALCKTQDIDASLVLVSTRDNGHRMMTLPSIDFNHCIAQVKLDGKSYYLELTQENLPFAVSNPSNHQVFALEIPQNDDEQVKAGILDSPNRLLNKISRKSDVSFDGDDMSIKTFSQNSGYWAGYLRDRYENISKEMQKKNMQEAINEQYPGIRLTVFEFDKGLNDNSSEITYRYDYIMPNVFTQISDLQIFTLPWSDSKTNPEFLATENREYPIELWQYFARDYEEEVLNIQIPAGYTIAEVPEKKEIATNDFRYSMSFELNNKLLIVKRTFELTDDIVHPEDYIAFKAAMEQVVKLDAQKMAFMPVP